MHWKHSRYQILHVILANCHTYDEAYRVLRELEEDREFSIKLALVESKRAQSKVIAAKEILKDTQLPPTEFEKLRAQADIDETDARRTVAQDCLDVARDELNFIRTLIAKVNPLRTWRDYSDSEAHQYCQPLEWRLDLMWKAYNMICATGMISYDHYINIKMLPNANQMMNVIDLFKKQYQTDHKFLLARTKSDVFSEICEEEEHFIEKPLSALLGAPNDNILRIESTHSGIEFGNTGTDE